jgi:hypothetical protein
MLWDNFFFLIEISAPRNHIPVQYCFPLTNSHENYLDTNLGVFNHVLISDTTHQYLRLSIVWICFKYSLCFQHQVDMRPLHSCYGASLQISF